MSSAPTIRLSRLLRVAEERRRFVIVSNPRHLFSEAIGEAARRTTNTTG
jgi:hypothetical protein